MRRSSAKKKQEPGLSVQRGSLVTLKKGAHYGASYGIVVSNDIQNDISDIVLVVPVERRVSRLKAPFAVDLGRGEGLRALHTARADWVTQMPRGSMATIERAALRGDVMERIDSALRAALSL